MKGDNSVLNFELYSLNLDVERANTMNYNLVNKKIDAQMNSDIFMNKLASSEKINSSRLRSLDEWYQ